MMYYRLITFVFSPIKCLCVRQEAVSLSLIQLQEKESDNDDRAEEVALASTSLTHFQPLYLQKPQRNGELNSGKQFFYKLLLLLLFYYYLGNRVTLPDSSRNPDPVSCARVPLCDYTTCPVQHNFTDIRPYLL